MLRSTSSPSAGLDPVVHVLQWRGLQEKDVGSRVKPGHGVLVGHESVRTLVADILRYGFGVAYHAIDHEVRLPEVHDVLKTLYEGLIDPAQRHDLGEYYIPDSSAAKVTARALTDPLSQRMLDPACGSGTFLFHAIRLKLAAAEAAEWPRAAAISACVQQVRGLDVHPVAVISPAAAPTTDVGGWRGEESIAVAAIVEFLPIRENGAKMSPEQFIAKWRGTTRTERSAAQEHFLDLCTLLDVPKPADVDRHGTEYTFEKSTRKIGDTTGFADVGNGTVSSGNTRASAATWLKPMRS